MPIIATATPYSSSSKMSQSTSHDWLSDFTTLIRRIIRSIPVIKFCGPCKILSVWLRRQASQRGWNNLAFRRPIILSAGSPNQLGACILIWRHFMGDTSASKYYGPQVSQNLNQNIQGAFDGLSKTCVTYISQLLAWHSWKRMKNLLATGRV